MSALDRPAAYEPTGLPTDTRLRALVDDFYAEVRRDPLLGPVFDAKVEDWDAHEARLTDFWSSVVFGSGRYKGNPFAVHLSVVPMIEDRHFQRWLELWGTTARRMFDPAIAEMLEIRAARIGASVKAGLLFSPGARPGSTATAAPP